eukprot:scaffold32054_cov26-Phaeocystis_antarctica.AAC.1
MLVDSYGFTALRPHAALLRPCNSRDAARARKCCPRRTPCTCCAPPPARARKCCRRRSPCTRCAAARARKWVVPRLVRSR